MIRKLLLGLLKLVIGLLVFALSGKWPDFERLERQARERSAPRVPVRPRERRLERAPTAARPAGRSWQRHTYDGRAGELHDHEGEAFAQEGEAYDHEGEAYAQEGEAYERSVEHTRVDGAHSAHSVKSSLRDRRSLRAAVVLGAALAPRRPIRR